ncbi:MAG: outer membrane lipoprotein carrier protein LolA [Victivallaceae bacterium]
MILALVVCGIVLNAENPAAVPVDAALAEVNLAMREMTTFSAKFKQIKKFRILTSNIVLDGSIYINRSPFKLAWHIEKPMRYTVIMSEDRLLQWDEETADTKEYKFTDNPVLEMVAKTYHDILLGDFSRLAGECDIVVDKPAYAIKVTPLAKSNMSKAVSQITFIFNQNFRHLLHISIVEPGGNSTTIDFSEIKINGAIPEKAWTAGNDS